MNKNKFMNLSCLKSIPEISALRLNILTGVMRVGMSESNMNYHLKNKSITNGVDSW